MAGHQTLDQRRAAHAWRVVQQVKDEGRDDARREFKLQAKRLPARVVTAGLGQALAFLEAKDYAPHLRAALTDWIGQQVLVAPGRTGDRLLRWVVEGDSDFLRLATAECLVYLQWVVRFAEAEFRDISDVEEV
ncbi:type III-B CRISPR module-associated protein Cmr5 [Tautonia marina]|uniref:type III-B CRISPR module-associated protein Cmr5 n=1 Tax=Tautonia marina TaxID=2653855 RepID=UPI001261084C|nr:type III-B CRISPR module-associated protein Cmr5 [Tautonia marina]